jgi:hypothetical protein
MNNIKYAIVGIFFGIVFVKSEVISWFRIQEMFRLDSFHMYGIIGTAVVVGAISVFLLKKFKTKTLSGGEITFAGKPYNKGTVIGGLLFGFDGRLSRSFVCQFGRRFWRSDSDDFECFGWYLGLWFVARQITSLRWQKKKFQPIVYVIC